ncbi:M20/M25/M40 family metallo-hydrolase [Clostridium sp. C2-6-12]|uniref:M20/M25/M40 family metallo-hydrolase n=1 Tax=Clostridium sp. C2-6-12 TaxID=2698832 RepID=UPI00136FFAB0|nr:M20/M25/M40 family metallo-hydrolase [Clostridium sp. C2-6-12]
MSQIEKAFSYIDSKAEDMKKLWINISKIESPSEYKSGVDSVAELLAHTCEKDGLNTKIITFENAGNSLVAYTKQFTEKNDGIVLMGHMDTVHKLGIFKEPMVFEKDGFLYGPGVFDCKGGLIIAILVVNALKASGYSKRPIKLFFTGDEEIGHRYSDNGKVISDELKGAAAVFNCESAPIDGKLAVGRKSSYVFKIIIDGVGAHSGSDPEKGRSAILEAAYKIIELEKLTDIDGTGTTVNCGLISGGTVVNAIPDNCIINVNIRFKSESEIEHIIKEVKKIIDKSYVEGTHSEIISHNEPEKPMTPNEKNMKLYNHYAKVSASLGFEKNEPYFAGGGSDAVIAYRLGIPVLCQTGVRGENHHTLQERAEIISLVERAKILTKAIFEIEKEF